MTVVLSMRVMLCVEMVQFAVSTLVEPKIMIKLMHTMLSSVMALFSPALSLAPTRRAAVQRRQITRDMIDTLEMPMLSESNQSGYGTPNWFQNSRKF